MVLTVFNKFKTFVFIWTAAQHVFVCERYLRDNVKSTLFTLKWAWHQPRLSTYVVTLFVTNICCLCSTARSVLVHLAPCRLLSSLLFCSSLGLKQTPD